MKISKDIYKRIHDTWGEESQFNMMTEEMGELLQAISKYRRAKTKTDKRNALVHLCEEIADVENMINQFRYMFDEELIDKFKEEKLKRTDNILKNSKNAK